MTTEWFERDALSRRKLRRLFLEGEQGKFGCGTARSLENYQNYAGVDFRNRVVTDEARSGAEPADAARPPDARHSAETRSCGEGQTVADLGD